MTRKRLEKQIQTLIQEAIASDLDPMEVMGILDYYVFAAKISLANVYREANERREHAKDN